MSRARTSGQQVYGVINGQLSVETQTSWSRQLGPGFVYGAVLWFVNFQIIARVLYPWFLMAPQFLQMAMHALFFGLPLELMYGRGERRVQYFQRAPRHA